MSCDDFIVVVAKIHSSVLQHDHELSVVVTANSDKRSSVFNAILLLLLTFWQ